MKLRKRIKHDVIYGLIRTAIWLFNLMSRRLAIYIAGWLGLLVWRVSAKERYKAVRHLTLVYGDELTVRQKEDIGRRFFVNSAKNVADFFRFRKHFSKEILPLITAEGMEHLREAFAPGKGVIGITGHIGNFELLAAYMKTQGFDVAVISRRMYDPRMDKILTGNRESAGLTVFSTTESPRRILAWLKQGNGLGVLIDTDSHRVRGEFVPAFGRWSYTPIGQSVLGLRTGSQFLPMACLRTENDTYRIIVRPAIRVEPSGDFDTDVYNVTLACTKELEGIIKDHPDQWIWHHNRWRTQREAAQPKLPIDRFE
jgi:KDO2-lipid IV(A) lauroyltransferase